MPSLSPEEQERFAAHSAFVGRPDAGRHVLEPGASLAVGTLRITLVSISRRVSALGGCGNSVGPCARLRVGEGRCAREVELGPDPEVVPLGVLSVALSPESDTRRAVLVIG